MTPSRAEDEIEAVRWGRGLTPVVGPPIHRFNSHRRECTQPLGLPLPPWFSRGRCPAEHKRPDEQEKDDHSDVQLDRPDRGPSCSLAGYAFLAGRAARLVPKWEAADDEAEGGEISRGADEARTATVLLSRSAGPR